MENIMKIFENKKYLATVVYDENADAIDRNAVYEFCRFIKSCTTVNQPAYSFIPNNYSNYIFIGGNNSHAKTLGINVPYDKFDDDTVYILVKDNYVVLDGGIRGKLYAVYEFLERFCGVRFYAPEYYKTPISKTVEIDEQEIIYTPPLKFRETYSPDVRFNNQFSARIRSNSEEQCMALGNYGGGLKWAEPKSHTSFAFLFRPEDEETGFDKHPEYYAYRKDLNARLGRHMDYFGSPWGEGEICWSNPEVINILTDRVKAWILAQKNKEIFSISQNDWTEYCQCPECEKLAEKYARVDGPAWNAPMLLAVNEIAKRIKQWQTEDERVKDRKIYIETMAYEYSTQPPKGIVLEDNVLIRFCTHENCFYHAYRDKSCPINSVFAHALEGWKKCAKQIYVWDYTANHTFYETFNTCMRHFQDNIQYFVENNAIGVFEEFQDFQHTGLYSQIRQYMIARVLWNPYIDYDAEFKEIMEFFYEEAAPEMIEIEKSYYDNTDTINDFHPRISRMIDLEEFNPEFLKKVTNLFEKALSKVKKEEVKLRIKRDYVCVKFTKVAGYRDNIEEMKNVLDEMEVLEVPCISRSRFENKYFKGQYEAMFDEYYINKNKQTHLARIEMYKELSKKFNGEI